MKKTAILLYLLFAIVFFCFMPSLASACLEYDRTKAMIYAGQYWNRPNDAKYRVDDNDCTNFGSQAAIAGGIDFSECPGRTDIGKGNKAGTKGIVGVSKLVTALANGFCFEITGNSRAKPGDFIVGNKGSHVTIVADESKRYFYGHTNDSI